MAGIKLGKLPERTPVKQTITISPHLKAALDDYAEFYRTAYDNEEPIADLIPAMLESFLESDRAFQKLRAAQRDKNVPRDTSG